MKKLALVISTILLAQTANADSCGTSLMPAFTAAQATQLCNVITAGDIALDNNAYLTARNAANTADLNLLKADTGDETRLESSNKVILVTSNDPQRLLRFGGASDAALSLTFGDEGVTAAQILKMSPSTTNTDDDGGIEISGGGATADATRGAFIDLYGNQHVGFPGRVDLFSGSDAGTEDILIGAVDDVILRLAQDAQRHIVFDSSSDTQMFMTFGDGGTTAAQTLNIVASNSNGDDDATLCITGGGGGCGSNARGAYVNMSGADFGGADAGDMSLGSTDDIIVYTGSGATLALTIDQAQAATFAGTVRSSATTNIGWSLVAATAQTCETVCTSACVLGQDTATKAFQACSASITGSCLCAGAS
jgi:hypothetical protein